MSYSTATAYSTSPMIIFLAIAIIIGIIIYFKSKKTLCQKIILSLIPVVIFLCIVVFITNLQKDSTSIYPNNDLITTEETTFLESETSRNNNTTPLSKWGFNTLSEMGNYLIQINGYNLSADKPYVYFESRTKYDSPTSYLFENGYWFNCEISGDDAIGYTLQKKQLAGLYNIIDNNSIYWYGSNDWDSGSAYMIMGRKTASKSNFLILEMGWDSDSIDWYIPYSLIDWERGICEYEQKGEYACYYKLYLKD